MFYGSDTAGRLRGGAFYALRMAGFSLKTSEKRKGRYRYKQYPPFPLRFLFEKTGNVLFSRAVSSQVHSALRGLTSVFGMGTGGSLLLSSPVWLSMSCTLTTTQHSPQTYFSFSGLYFTVCDQALDLLVSVSSIHYCTYTPDLSTL